MEWFATREDLARTMAWHLATAHKPGLRPVAEILSLETPIPFDGEAWPYVGYKGGSEMGCLSATWLLERADGRHFSTALVFATRMRPLIWRGDRGDGGGARPSGTDHVGRRLPS